jgi:tetratricopeptide (TPR) repeat protein
MYDPYRPRRRRYPSFRERRRAPFWRLFLWFVLIAVGLLVLYYLYFGTESSGPLTAEGTLTPFPTPTPSSVALAAEADDAYWQGRLEEAVAGYEAALDLEPEQADLYVKAARLAVFAGRPQRGLQLAREATALAPDNAFAWAVMGMAYDWLGMQEEAIRFCQKAVDLDPTLAEAHAYLAEAYVDAGNWIAANDEIETALELDATNVDVLRNHGYVLEVQGNYSGAIEAYREALAQRLPLPHIYLAMARNQEALGLYTQALESYEEALKHLPDDPAVLDALGWAYLLQGEYGQAEKMLLHALEVAPDNWKASGHLGTLYFQRRNYEDAIPAFQQAIRLGEAAQRQRVVSLRLTREALPVGEEPTGETVAEGEFVFPRDGRSPLRAVLRGEGVEGVARLDPLDGHYALSLRGLETLPPQSAYVLWFEGLLAPERTPVHSEPLTPQADGRLDYSGITGPVKGPPIEFYYTEALCYYFLDQCDKAEPYIQVALRIDPEDANALETYRLCHAP